MKSLATVGAAALIAAAGALWFASGPTIVTMKVEPLKPSADLPTFKRIGVGMTRTIPRRRSRPSYGETIRPKWRAQGKPGARLAPIAPRAKMKKHTSVVATGSPEHPAFPAQWF